MIKAQPFPLLLATILLTACSAVAFQERAGSPAEVTATPQVVSTPVPSITPVAVTPVAELLTGPRVARVGSICMPTEDWAPDGKTLAYAGKEGGIWLATAPDFTPRQLSIRGDQPKWSPDQRLATLWEDAYPNWYIQVFDPSGQLLQQMNLVIAKSALIDRWLDNERLTVVIHVGAPGEELHEVNLGEQAIRPLVSPEGGTLSTILSTGEIFHWSPDLRFLAVEWGTAALPGRITIIDVAKREEIHLAQLEERRYQQFEAWAPDGTRFLYEEMEGTNAPLTIAVPRLFVWDVTEKRGREILPNVWGAAWSSKGEIAFLLLGNPTRDAQGQITSTDFRPGQPFDLYIGVMDATTYEVKTLLPIGQVTDVEAFQSGSARCGTLRRPVWSPDGSHLVYWDATGRVWAMTSDRRTRWSLGPETGMYAAAWSPDGNWLALSLEQKILILPRPGSLR